MAKKKNKKEKEKDTRLLKRAARELGIEWVKGQGLGDLIRSQADRVVRQSAAGGGRDDGEFGPDGGSLLYSRRDLTPVEQDRLIQIANYLAAQNLLANRIRHIRKDFVVGDGITIEADDPRVQKLIDEFWTAPVNNMDDYQFELVASLRINSDLIPPIFLTH